MNANEIKIGTKFEIEILADSKNSTSSPTYTSQLIDVIDAKTLSISAPMSEGRFKYLTIGLSIYIYYLNDTQDLLFFKASVKGSRKNGPLDAFDVLITSDVSKIQRRRFYRLEAALSCQYLIVGEQLLSTDKVDFVNQADLKSAFTKNISCSGCCLLLDAPIDAGSIIDITFNLDDTASIRVIAQVIRSIDLHSKKYEVGMNFIKISPRDSDILTKFIFEKQRLMLKNTLKAKIK